jgi:acetyl esterase
MTESPASLSTDDSVPWFTGRLSEGPSGLEAAEFNALVEAEGTGVSPKTLEELLASRVNPDAPAPEIDPAVRLEHHYLDGRAGEVHVRLFVPPEPRGGCLAIHGGGWVAGGGASDDPQLSAVALGGRLVVGSVDYRLAPEHPYPAAPDDCETAAAWFVDHLRGSLGLDRLVMNAGSAGAHLAAVTLLRLRDHHGCADAFAGVSLVGGFYDLSKTPSNRLWDRDLVLSREMTDLMIESFTPGLDPEARRSPDISPLYADLRGLPPALFMVGTADPLLDDTLFLAARWRAAGNESELRVFPEGVHGSMGLPLQLASTATAINQEFLERALTRSST